MVGRSEPRPVEVELKYRVTDEAVGERYLGTDSIGPFQAASPVRSSQIEDRYVDTADGALGRAGFAVRLRLSASGTVVSVKSTSAREGPGGSQRREELEGPADRTAGPLDWPASDARSLILEQAGDASLVELVTVRQLRRKRELRDGGTRVELSFDEVDIVTRSKVVGRFIELEVELLKGDERRLADLDRVLSADPVLRRSTTSKLEAAMAAVRGTPETSTPEVVPTTSDDVRDEIAEAPGPEPTHLTVGKTPGVAADDHIAEAGRKVLRFHLARMLAREPGTREGKDPEELHAMRVATRRQRAAWRVFGASFRPGRTKRYRTGLREIAGRLGAVRDLDVLLEAVDAYRADIPAAESRALEPLLADWRERREDARVLLVRELDSDGYRRWVDDYRDFVRTEGAAVLPVGPVQPHRVRDTTPSRIWAAYEQVRGYEAALRWADVETLHELRIAGKWLRYTLEFVREALGPESAPLIARVTALQDHLGLINDADVAASMARTFLVEHAGEVTGTESAAIGRYLVSREREVARLRRTVGTPWRGVVGVRFRRGLGRVVAGL
jgi:CHAD domain-containing protein